MTRIKWLAISLVLLLALFAKLEGWAALDLRSQEFTDFGVILASITLVAAVMERVLDVFLTFTHGSGADTTIDALQSAERQLSAAKLLTDRDDQSLGMASAEEALSEAKENRRAQRNSTRQSALCAAIVLGTLISAMGVRVLESLFVVPAPEPQASWLAQPNLFHVIDVIVTGFLLAGGSDGLHKLMEVYRNVTEKRS